MDLDPKSAIMVGGEVFAILDSKGNVTHPARNYPYGPTDDNNIYQHENTRVILLLFLFTNVSFLVLEQENWHRSIHSYA